MKKEEKQKLAEQLRAEIERARTVVFSSFEGLTVAQDTELRRKLAAVGGRYRVVKNALIERAAAGTPAGAVVGKLRGTTSLAYTDTDPVALAKVMTGYAKENPVLVFKAGMVEGRVVPLADFAALASLPSREALFSKVLFLINSPAIGVLSAASGVARKLAVVIQQAIKENKFRQVSEG